MEVHEPGSCKRTLEQATSEDDRNTVACVNCNMVGHPANFKNCPYYRNLLKDLQERNKIAIQRELRQRRSFTNYVQPGLSYASATDQSTVSQSTTARTNLASTKPRNTQSSSPFNTNSTPLLTQSSNYMAPTNNFQYLQTECNNLIGSDLFSTLHRINEFVESHITDHTVKKNTFIAFLIELSSSICLSKP